jgi:hypothetical protein
MVGIGNNRFGPDDNLTRAMIVTILYRLEGEPGTSGIANTFFDVPNNEWFANAVKWGTHNGIVLGYGDGSFGPDDLVTKEQLAAMISRAQQSSGKIPPNRGSGKNFIDANRISDYAKPAVNALNNQGLFDDIAGVRFNPQTPATRAEVASILHRYLAN